MSTEKQNELLNRMNEKLTAEFKTWPESMQKEWHQMNKGIPVNPEAIRTHCWQCTSCSNERETIAIAICPDIRCVFHKYRSYRLNSRGVYDFYNPVAGLNNSYPKKKKNISPELSRKRREAALKMHEIKSKKQAA